jgi:hypothetical protein
MKLLYLNILKIKGVRNSLTILMKPLPRGFSPWVFGLFGKILY